MEFTYAGQWGPDALLDAAGNASPASSAVLRMLDGVTPATAYTDETRAVVADQPLYPDAVGNLTLFARPGRYLLVVSTPGSPLVSVPITVPVDPREVADEADARVAGDETLTATLDAESAARAAADNAEATARAAADAAFADDLAAEVTARTAADEALADDLDTEAATRTAAVAQEAAARAAADQAEALARVAGDAATMAAAADAQAAADAAVPATALGVSVATLTGGKVPAEQLPPPAPSGVESVNGQTGEVVLPSDGAAGVASLRTLGDGATQAAAGNDMRLSNPRVPSGPAGGALSGTYPDPEFAQDMATQAELDAEATARAAADAAEAAARANADALLVPLTQRGAANGVATLDAAGRVPVAQMPDDLGELVASRTSLGRGSPLWVYGDSLFMPVGALNTPGLEAQNQVKAARGMAFAESFAVSGYRMAEMAWAMLSQGRNPTYARIPAGALWDGTRRGVVILGGPGNDAYNPTVTGGLVAGALSAGQVNNYRQALRAALATLSSVSRVEPPAPPANWSTVVEPLWSGGSLHISGVQDAPIDTAVTVPASGPYAGTVFALTTLFASGRADTAFRIGATTYGTALRFEPTDYWRSAGEGATVASIAATPQVVRLAGLPTGAQTIRAVKADNSGDFGIIDAYLIPSTSPPPIVVMKSHPWDASKAGYSASDANTAANVAVVDANRVLLDAVVDEVVAEFPNAFACSPGFTFADYGADGVHLSNRGMRTLTDALIRTLDDIADSGYNPDAMYPTNPPAVAVRTASFVAEPGRMFLVNAAAGAVVATLGETSAGDRVTVKKTDATANTVTLVPAVGTIDGATTRVLSVQHAAVEVIFDGVVWHTLSGPATTRLTQTYRNTTGSIAAGATVEYTATWPTPFASANYTLAVYVEEGTGGSTRTLEVGRGRSHSATQVVVSLTNLDAINARTGTLHFIGIHD